MTIVVAAIKGNKGVMCADSLITSTDKKHKNTNHSKIIKFPKFYVGYAGFFSVHTTLRELASNSAYLKKKHLKMKSQEDASLFSRDVCLALASKISYLGDGKKEILEDTSLIILTEDGKIYIPDQYGGVEEYSGYAAIGGGEDYSLGALGVLYKDCPDIVEAVEQSVKVACKHVTSCGGDLKTVVINLK